MKLVDNYKDTLIPIETIKKNLNTYINSEKKLEIMELIPDTTVFANFAIIPGKNPPNYLNADKVFSTFSEQSLNFQEIKEKKGHKIIFLQYFDPETENLLHLDYLSSYLKIHFPEATILADVSYVIGKQPLYLENWGIEQMFLFYNNKLYNIYPTGTINETCDNFIDYFYERQKKIMENNFRSDEDNITFAPMWKIIVNGKTKYIT